MLAMFFMCQTKLLDLKVFQLTIPPVLGLVWWWTSLSVTLRDREKEDTVIFGRTKLISPTISCVIQNVPWKIAYLKIICLSVHFSRGLRQPGSQLTRLRSDCLRENCFFSLLVSTVLLWVWNLKFQAAKKNRDSSGMFAWVVILSGTPGSTELRPASAMLFLFECLPAHIEWTCTLQ